MDKKELKKNLIREIISMYHTTRMAETPVEDHILSKPCVQKAFAKLLGEREDINDGYFLSPYSEKGHRFDIPVKKCIRCGEYAINIFEDAAYGDIRECIPNVE